MSLFGIHLGSKNSPHEPNMLEKQLLDHSEHPFDAYVAPEACFCGFLMHSSYHFGTIFEYKTLHNRYIVLL